MSGTPSYRMIDADSHLYEPDDAFSRHIEPDFRDMAVHLAPGGVTLNSKEPSSDVARWAVGDRYITFSHHNPADHRLKPGALMDFLNGEQGRLEVDFNSALITPKTDLRESMDRDVRLGWMNEHDIEACLMLPTKATTVPHDMHDMPDVLQANLRSFNRWMEEDWGFGSDRRIFGVPVMSLVGVDEAVTELERVAVAGARFFTIKLGPVYDRSPAHPDFDRFWAAAQETGMQVILHIDNSGYTEMISPLWGEPANVPNVRYSAFQTYMCLVERPVQDTLASMILHNLFGRFPGLQVLVIECGSTWVELLLHDLDKVWRMAANDNWFGGKVEDKPSDIFRNHVRICPYPEEDIAALAGLIGADRVLFGSDWPHPEGIAEPRSYFDKLTSLPETDVRKIMRDNLGEMLGLTGNRQAVGTV